MGDVLDNIKRAMEMIHAKGNPRLGRIVRAEEDELGVVFAYDEGGAVVCFCSRKDWDATRRALGVSSLEPVRVNRGGAP